MNKKLLFLLTFVFSFINYGQNSGDIKQLYGIRNGLSLNHVKTTAIQSDGKIIVGGQFTTYNSKTQNYIIRLNVDGTQDTSFNIGTGFNNYINTILVQSDGKILVGGNFTSYNGTSQNYITRLNTNGSIDTSFSIGLGFSNEVLTLSQQTNGKIVAGGKFTSFNGLSRNYIARLNSNGSIDTSFSAGTVLNGDAKSLAIESGGKIYVGGSFTGTIQNRLTRLNSDGSRDTTFNIGTGFNNDVLTLAIQTDGKILAGGSFTTYNGSGYDRIIRLNINGNVDTTFKNIQLDSNVNTLVLQTDGKIIVGGSFTTYNLTNLISGAQSQNKICRLMSDGNLDANFIVGTGFNDSATVRSVTLQSNGKIIIGGTLNTYDQISTLSGITSLNTDGSPDLNFNSVKGFDFSVYTVASQSDGKSIVGGNFTSYKGIIQNRICRLNPDGTIDSTFNTGTGFNSSVNIIFIQPDGKILVGGNFTSYNGTLQNFIVRLNSDGSIDPSFNVDTSFIITNGDAQGVSAISYQSDGKILIGGKFFTSYNGSSKNYLIRLLSNGSLDTTFNSGTGFNAIVRTIAIQSNGKIIAGGDFTSYNGNTKNYIISLNSNGSIDTSFNMGTGFSSNIFIIGLQNNGKILVNGSTFYNGIGQNRSTIQLNSDGSVETSFKIDYGIEVNTFSFQPDGKIIIGGYLTAYDGNGIQYCIIRLNTDGTRDMTYNSGVGFDSRVTTLALQSDGSLLVGGTFNSYNNTSAASLIKLYIDKTLGYETFDSKKALVYPNPVKDILHLENLDNSYYQYEIFDLQGKKVNTGELTEEINVSNLTKGIYLLKIKSSEKTYKTKFIKE